MYAARRLGYVWSGSEGSGYALCWPSWGYCNAVPPLTNQYCLFPELLWNRSFSADLTERCSQRIGSTVEATRHSKLSRPKPQNRKTGSANLRLCDFGSYIMPLICASPLLHVVPAIPCEATTFAVLA